jgi:hypothetical protein
MIAFEVIIPHLAPDGVNPFVARHQQWGDTNEGILLTLQGDCILDPNSEKWPARSTNWPKFIPCIGKTA